LTTIKSDFNTLLSVKDITKCRAHPTLFFVRGETYHKAFKRLVVIAYSTSMICDLDPLAVSCIRIPEAKLDTKQNYDIGLESGRTGYWFAWDAIFSRLFLE
jgi:hypothetical protein